MVRSLFEKGFNKKYLNIINNTFISTKGLYHHSKQKSTCTTVAKTTNATAIATLEFLQKKVNTLLLISIDQSRKIEGDSARRVGKHQKSKQRRQDLCWKVHDRAQSFVLRSYTMHESNVTKTFLLVSSSVSSKQLLCFVHGQGQKREQKPRTKNFVEFHNHYPPLTTFQSP